MQKLEKVPRVIAMSDRTALELRLSGSRRALIKTKEKNQQWDEYQKTVMKFPLTNYHSSGSGRRRRFRYIWIHRRSILCLD